MRQAQINADITPEALAALGLQHLAYIKDVLVEGEVQYAIHGADGRVLGITTARDVAFAAARQNDLEPVSVH